MAQSERGGKLDSSGEIQYSPSSFWISCFSLGSRRNYPTLERTGSAMYGTAIIPSRCTRLVARHLSSLCHHSSPNTGLSGHVEVGPLLSAADGKRPARSLAHCVGRTETPGTWKQIRRCVGLGLAWLWGRWALDCSRQCGATRRGGLTLISCPARVCLSITSPYRRRT